MRKNIPCFQQNVSCGLECGKKLGCGHLCRRTCHVGACETEPCKQPCETKRPACGHICGRPCHPGETCEPFDSCGTMIGLKCACGRRKQRITCEKYQQMLSHQRRAQQKQSNQSQGAISISLECDNECDIQARNRRIAEALDIEQERVFSERGA